MTERERDLWFAYRHASDDAARGALLDLYLGLVHSAVREVIVRSRRTSEFDDLLGAGAVGLVQALESFEPARGFAFSTFAMPRIRGAIYDELRRQSPVPRSVRNRRLRIENAAHTFAQRQGRLPTDDELAHVLGTDPGTLKRWQASVSVRETLPLNLARQGAASEGLRLCDLIPDDRQPDPSDEYHHQQLLMSLRAAVDALPERDRLVLTLSFVEDMSLREIGQVLQITESRVCQIRKQVLGQLRESLALAA